jgi:hypothetical protein
LASKGIRTSFKSKYSLKGVVVAQTRHGIPITVKDLPDSNNVYPVEIADVKREFDKKSPSMLKGLKEINFRKPGIPATKQDKAWAQYARGDKRINIFTQKFDGNKLVDVDYGLEAPNDARKYMLKYVIPHEVSHHTIQHVWGYNKDPMIVEEARADALTFGKNPFDKQTEREFIKEREASFGPKGSV